MSLLEELKRRKVFKVAAAYLVVGWVLIQVASTVAPQLNLPDWAPRLITFAILLGFPIALLLAWLLDATPDGVRVDAATAGNKRVFAAVAVLAAAAIGWYAWRGRPAPDASDAGTHSIAVLPFVNMSDDKSNEFFSDGISEEILNVLARMADLRVAARTSSFAFRNQEKEIPTIARDLKVRMVLEGSVRKQGERVRVTAQLIDAHDGYHVWSQTYDRDLKDIFAIQDEIANAIANELKLKLDNGRGAAAAPVADTADIAAYELYLKGIGLWQARGDANLHQAIALFEAALKRDPNYAKAWAGLGLVYAILPEWSTDPLAETLPKGRDAAERALALDPGLPEPYAVLGYIAAAELRFPAARAMFKRAVAIAPSYATGWQWSGETLWDEGDLDAALAAVRTAAALDPKSSIVNSVLANVLFANGKADEAVALCDAIVAIEAEWCPLVRFDAAMARKDFARARAAVEPAAKNRGPEAEQLFRAQMDALDGKGDVAAIERRTLDLVDGQLDPAGPTPLGAYEVMLWYMALARNDLAIERFQRMIGYNPYAARQIAVDPHFAALHCEPKFVDLLRRLRVEEPQLARACPGGA